ncbi:hypothetical protein GCM10007984_15580 [Shewanella putrefaciens]|nr:conserved hypothetical protein [Shewanella sp. W3-18-1]GGN17594.1 hypothetical protein GCM10007984_15580 [Shewanella putrefaciens]
MSWNGIVITPNSEEDKMKGIIAAQSPTVNDTCTDCGSFVDIGAVIDEHDIVLEIQFTGASAKDDAENMAERAKARFGKTQAKFVTVETGMSLQLVFDVSAEKMIFQLENGL